VKEIPLTQGKVALVDDDRFEELNAFKWYASYDGWNWYASRSDHSNGGQRTVLMHRQVMGLQRGDKRQVDHKDGDGLNNMLDKLRIATNQQNTFNQRRNKNNQSGFKGASWQKHKKKWLAQIMINGKTKFLGLFDTPEAAHAAYLRAAHELHGDFARAA
jgi:hypothetical protein